MGSVKPQNRNQSGNEIAVFWGSCYSDDVGRRDMWRELKKGELTHAKRQSRSRTTLVTVGDSSNAPEPVRCGPRSLESRRSCRPLTRIRLAGRPAKKHALNGAAGCARGKVRISELLGLVGDAIRVAQPSLSPLPSRLLAFYCPLDPLGFAGGQLSGIRFIGLTSGTR